MEMVVIVPQGYIPPRGIVIGKRLKKEKYDETRYFVFFPWSDIKFLFIM